MYQIMVTFSEDQHGYQAVIESNNFRLGAITVVQLLSVNCKVGSLGLNLVADEVASV